MFSGVIVDLWSKRLLLIYSNVARCLLAIGIPASRAITSTALILDQHLLRHGEPVLRHHRCRDRALRRADGSAHRRQQRLQPGRHRVAAHRHDLPRADPVADASAPTWLFVIAALMFAVAVGCAWLMPPIPEDDAAPDRSWPDVPRAAQAPRANTSRRCARCARDPVALARADPLRDRQLARAALRGARPSLHAGGARGRARQGRDDLRARRRRRHPRAAGTARDRRALRQEPHRHHRALRPRRSACSPSRSSSPSPTSCAATENLNPFARDGRRASRSSCS